jgi:hypothetical protein
MHPLQDRPGPSVEVAAAGATLIVQPRIAVVAVDAEALLLAASGAGQLVRMQRFQELGEQAPSSR